jgi:hypothetical protein
MATARFVLRDCLFFFSPGLRGLYLYSGCRRRCSSFADFAAACHGCFSAGVRSFQICEQRVAICGQQDIWVWGGCRLTDLLHSEMRVLGLELLVHGVPEDDPTVHWSRCLSFDRRCGLGANNSSHTGFGWVGWLSFQLQSDLLVLGHLNESLGDVAIVHGGEGDGWTDLLSQAVLEVFHECVTEQMLDVGLEQHCLIAIAPSKDAGIECALELVHHGFLSVRCVGIDGRWRRKIRVGGHCQVWSMDERNQKKALQTCLCLCQRVR